ncbi:hypothetical protein ZIOFF_044951 [Zingiber officinale]|uniref:Uncharacterized protein n=1 Tax=Zingiber officinale TaxID=94328 RepID=A0A8J5L0L9_ZINOF|nr:hypothetical protein ZIOFF_044951 [Zingiber officinale]
MTYCGDSCHVGTVISSFPGSSLLTLRISNWIAITATSNLQNSIRRDKFLENQCHLISYSILKSSMFYVMDLSGWEPFEVFNGSGWKWTKERDLDQLTQCRKELVDGTEVIWILWLDHWPVIDYAKISEYLVVVDEIEKEIAKITSKIRDVARWGEADLLLEDDSIPCGWKDGFVPFEKKRLGIKDMFFRLLNGVHKFAHRRNWVSIICIPHHQTTR